MSEVAFQKPMLAWNNPAPYEGDPDEDELTHALIAIRLGMRVIMLCVLLVCRVLLRRLRAGVDTFLASLFAAWLLAGFGWGGVIALTASYYFMR